MDSEGQLRALSYTILYEGLEHPWVWVSVGGLGAIFLFNFLFKKVFTLPHSFLHERETELFVLSKTQVPEPCEWPAGINSPTVL